MPVFKFLPVAPSAFPPTGGSILVLALLPFSLDDFRISPGAITLLTDVTDPANSFSISFKGGGFVTGFDGTDVTVVKGTIRSITAHNDDGDLILQATGLNLSAKTVFNLIDGGSAEALINYVMQTNDRVEGSSLGDLLYGAGGRDTIVGFGGEDELIGLDGNDRLLGGNQMDQLRGGMGRDTMLGGSGADTLEGEEGKDVLTGGAGADAFRFNAPLGASNIDTITDFRPGVDVFELDNDIFLAAGPLGALASTAFHVGGAAADASDRTIYTKSTGLISYDFNGNAAGGGFAFAKVTPGTNLTFADFLIIE